MTFEGIIEAIVGPERPRSVGARTRHGEWDWTVDAGPHVLRRLTGAGFFKRGGMNIDEFADLVCSKVPGVDTLDDAMVWYVNQALAELDERQNARRGRVAWEDQVRPDPAGRRMPGRQSSVIGLGRRQVAIVDVMSGDWQSCSAITQTSDVRWETAGGLERRELLRAVRRNLRVLEARGVVELDVRDGEVFARLL